MLVRSRTTAAIVVAASLLLFTGCSPDSAVDDDATSQTDESATDDSDAETDDSDDGSSDDDDEAGADNPAGGAVYTDPAADSVQVSLSETGFDPSSVSVPVGGTVTFTGTDDGPHGVFVGDLDGYTAMGGLTATFRFDTAGTYDVYDEMTEAEMTVTVG